MLFKTSVLAGGAALLVIAGVGVAPAASAAPAKHAAYRGTAWFVVDEYDYCGYGGARRFVRTYRYSKSAVLSITRPQPIGNRRENNPFHLAFLAGGTSSNGALQLHSSGIFSTSSGRVLLRYWSLSGRSGRFSGTLTNTHKAEGAVLNLFNFVKPVVPCRNLGSLGVYPRTISAGTRISGSSSSFTLAGSTYDGNFVFRMTFRR